MSRSPRARRPPHALRNLAAVKAEFKQLVGSLDPIAAFNHLHYEGIVSHSDKQEFDKHIEMTKAPLGGRRATTHAYQNGDHMAKKVDKKLAQMKLIELGEKSDSHAELKTIVSALNAFNKVHSKSKHRRHSLQPEDKQVLLEVPTREELMLSIPNGYNNEEITSRNDAQLKLLGAFEQGSHGHGELCQLLRENRDQCDIKDIANFEGKTLLHLACCMLLLETVEVLISEHNCDPNVQDSDGNTPLHEASRCRKVQIAKYLVNLPSCDPNIINNNGETPLHVALSKQHWGLGRELFKSGRIDLSIENKDGETAILLLERYPHSQEHVRMKKILERSASVISLMSLPSGSQKKSSEAGEHGVSRKISFGEDTMATFKKKAPTSEAIQTPERRPGSANRANVKKGILRPYDPPAIRTEDFSIPIDDSDEKEMIDKRQSQLSLKLKTTGIKQPWSEVAYNTCSLILKVSVLIFALLLCVGLLACLIYFLLTRPTDTQQPKQ